MLAPASPHRRIIIVPAFNERHTIARVVRDAHDALPDADILVIDDGSTDNTVACVPEDLATVISLPFNLGIGGAMRTGFRYAAEHGYDVAIQIDADGQHIPAEAHRLLERMARDNHDLVIGSRFLGPRRYSAGVPRRLGMRFLSTLLRILTGVRVSDPTSGFRAANREVIDVFARWYPHDYPEPQVIQLLRRRGHTVDEVAVEMLPRTSGRTSITLSHGIFYVAKVFVALIADRIRTPWPTIARPTIVPLASTPSTVVDSTVSSAGATSRKNTSRKNIDSKSRIPAS